MTITFTRKLHLLACALAAIGTFPLSADLLYDNSSNDLKLRFNPLTTEVADEITLAAPGFLTNFSFEYYATHNGDIVEPLAGNIQVQVTFYKMDGPAFNGFPSPGESFWTSGQVPITLTTQRNTLWFNTHEPVGQPDLPQNMLLPVNFAWSVQFSGMGTGDEVGVDLYNPVTVGSSAWDYWRKVDGVWTLAQTVPEQPLNFASRFEGTIPEPTTFTLLLIGALTATLIARHRQS